MKLAILPHWCKWLALALLITSFAIDFKDFKSDIIKGATYVEQLYENTTPISQQNHSDQAKAFPIGDLLILLSIIVYILSKDKWEDDYINTLRSQALLCSLLIASCTVIVTCFLKGRIEGTYLLLAQLFSYIIIFKILMIRSEVIWGTKTE